jgi:HSP20 family protein
MYCTPRFRRMPANIAGFPAPFSSFVAELMKPGACATSCNDESTAGAGPIAARLAVDIQEKDNTFVITASLPGFRKDEVSIEFEDGDLTIAATRAEVADASGQDANVTWHRRERRRVNLSRTLRMPETVNGEGISATLVDGVLTVTVPQTPAVEKKTKIAVN